MTIKFTKMQALGNDFIVIDSFSQQVDCLPAQARLLADRHFGIGCDQILWLAPCDHSVADAHYRIFNADGQEVEQCGNGARCAARYLMHHQYCDRQARLLTQDRVMVATTHDDPRQITVSLGRVDFSLSEETDTIQLGGKTWSCQLLSIGNPHCVIIVDDCAAIDVPSLGEQAQTMILADGINVGFMQIIDDRTVNLRVYERGVGETQACGSGAAANAVAGMQQQRLHGPVEVRLPGGILSIAWPQREEVCLTGPADFVFEGSISL